MSGKRSSEEFKIEAVKQVADRDYKIGGAAKRLGVIPKVCIGLSATTIKHISTQQDEQRRLKAELRRVTSVVKKI